MEGNTGNKGNRGERLTALKKVVTVSEPRLLNFNGFSWTIFFRVKNLERIFT